MIIVSGPSTIGKNPLIYKLCSMYNMNYLTPYTSRNRRPEESNCIDYFFLTKEDFQKEIISGKINHWDYCLNNYYGYAFDFAKGTNYITHGLSRMALRIKASHPNSVSTVFIKPKNLEDIDKTLDRIYCGEDLILRKLLVREEICHSQMFDHVFTVNRFAKEILTDSRLISIINNNK